MLIGVDVGGTKTQILGVSDKIVRFDETVATSNWRGRKEDDIDAAALVALINRLAGNVLPQVLVVGSHGCDTDEDCQALQSRLARLLPTTVLVLNDSELVPPAAGKDGGVSVICGTGSIAVTRRTDRRMITAGGWGWYLGDEGSASGLVREAARAVRGSLDCGEPLERLGNSLMEALGIDNPVELGRALSDGGSAARIGSFAPIVFDAAEAGSHLAERVIAEGGRALAALVARLAERGANGPDVVTGGGVITQQPRLFEAFRAALLAITPGWTLTLLSEPPVVGAIALARRLQAGQWPAHLPLPHVAGHISNEGDWRAA